MTRLVVMLVALLAVSLPSVNAAETVTITTGAFNAYGNDLEPPFVLTLNGARLSINGVSLLPSLHVPDPPPPVPPEIAAFGAQAHPLMQRIGADASDLVAHGKSLAEVDAFIINAYEASPIVDYVETAPDGALVVHWRSEVFPPFTVGNPQAERARALPQTPEDIAAQFFREFSAMLGDGWIVVYLKPSLIIPGDATRRAELQSCIAEVRAHGGYPASGPCRQLLQVSATYFTEPVQLPR